MIRFIHFKLLHLFEINRGNSFFFFGLIDCIFLGSPMNFQLNVKGIYMGVYMLYMLFIHNHLDRRK